MTVLDQVQLVPQIRRAPHVRRMPKCCGKACDWIGFNFWMCPVCGQLYVVRRGRR